MNRNTYFCHHLSEWLYESQWHFTTLLAACINSVKHLPDNADAAINELLLIYPEKPAKHAITSFLHNNTVVNSWFSTSHVKPEIVYFNLRPFDKTKLINNRLPDLHNTYDLAQWLNISSAELDWLADLWRHNEDTPSHLRHYHYSLAPKRDGGNRLIESPKYLLKHIQRKISNNIITYMPVHNAAHGFRKGRSCQTHAALHIGKKHVIHFDLSNYFQSIQWSPVYRLFKELGYNAKVAKYLTGICSHKCYIANNKLFAQIERCVKERVKQRHLPQGAPSSPALSNAVLIKLDKRLTGLAKSLDLTYSRYADDCVFSGNNNRDWLSFSALIGAICLEEGFSLNHRKTHLARSHQKQRVVGVIVNEKLNIDRRYYDRLKAILTNCIRYGYQNQNRANHPNFKDYLLGCIEHVKSLNSVKGHKLELLFNKID